MSAAIGLSNKPSFGTQPIARKGNTNDQEHTMITLTVAVEGKPYRKSPEALVELAHWAMLRYAQAWAAKRHTSAEKFFFAAERATREAKAIITCRSIRQAYSSQDVS